MSNKKRCISCSITNPTEYVLTDFALGVMRVQGGDVFTELPDGSAHFCKKTFNQHIKKLKDILDGHQEDQEGLKEYLIKKIKQRSLN